MLQGSSELLAEQRVNMCLFLRTRIQSICETDFTDFHPLTRLQILEASPLRQIDYIMKVINFTTRQD
jgi:hypothetical protein